MSNDILNTSINEIPFIPIRDLIGKSFKVKDYQRGYKWEAKEILELLSDVDEHDANNGKYCLQPVIVRENLINEKNEIELIDGQQRITSLYLILSFLKSSKEGIYDISYETREESKEFLSTKITKLNQYVKDNLSWEQFLKIKGFEKYDNVDVYHFYTVYKEIYQWFGKKTEVDFKHHFLDKIMDTVHVIWYDIDKSKNNSHLNVSAENVFLNLNAGKILLSSSELIKALFILDCQKNTTKEIAKLKSTELALEWDKIETKLHDDSFWFFICDDEKYNSSPTRIDFIIDIVNKRNVKIHDDLYSYRIYEKRFKEKEDLNWVELKNTYNKLTEWYDNKEIYHYVGFLIVGKIKNLSQIIDKSKGISKSDFKIELIEWIKLEFKRTKKDESGHDYSIYALANLDYLESRKECEKVLLLLNILYYINNGSSNKFPFELYKKETWSVEHINPQNPRDFENVGSIKGWLNTNDIYYKKSKQKKDSILQQITSVSAYFDNIQTNDQRKLSDLKLSKIKTSDLDNLVDAISLDLDLHGISNLALLDKNSNSKLSNQSFLAKRELILQFDQEGKYKTSDGKDKMVFIPVCTKNVFSKIYTTDKESVVDSFFGRNDMESYFLFITNQLKTFFNGQ